MGDERTLGQSVMWLWPLDCSDVVEEKRKNYESVLASVCVHV